MVTRIKPKGEDLDQLIDDYQSASKRGRIELAGQWGITIGTLRNWIDQSDHPQKASKLKQPSLSWHEHINLLKTLDRAMDRQLRVPNDIFREIRTDKPVGIVFTADWQLGQHGVDYEAFADDMEAICQQPYIKVSVGGDGYQNIIEPKKIGSSHNQAPISVQKALYVQTLEKLIESDKLAFIGTGNHNYWTALATGEDWDAEIVRRLQNVDPYLVYTKHGGMIRLKIGDMVYPIWREHKGPYESSFNPTHGPRQSQRVYHPEARIVVREHRHIGECTEYLYDGKKCASIRCGTYAVYDDFAQKEGFWGSNICNPTVILWPDQDKIVAFRDMRDGFQFLNSII
jgi:hypothetical protein